MAKQSQEVLEKLAFLESILERFKNNSYNQLRPLIENPQTMYEPFNGRSLRLLVYGLELKDGNLTILLSELFDWEGEEIRSWFTVGFMKKSSEEVVEPSFDKKTHCPFCSSVTNFSTDLPLEAWVIYHCQTCRNFFDGTPKPLRFIGASLCFVFGLISLFVLFVGLYILTVNIYEAHLMSRFSIGAAIMIIGGGGMLYVLSKKIWKAITTPMLQRVSDFELYYLDGDV